MTNPDADMNGVPESEDCDDQDPNNFPGNEEICDGQDNDCDLRIAFGEDGYLLWNDPNDYYWCGGDKDYTDAGIGQVNPPMGGPADCKGHGSLGSGWDFSTSNIGNAGLTMCGGDTSTFMLANYGNTVVSYPNPGAA